MKLLRLALCLLLTAASASFAAAQGTAAKSATDPPKAKEMPVEKVEGFWSVMGYFGGKLTEELGQRLNLSDKDDSEGVPTRVDVKLGPFEISRTEKRKPA